MPEQGPVFIDLKEVFHRTAGQEWDQRYRLWKLSEPVEVYLLHLPFSKATRAAAKEHKEWLEQFPSSDGKDSTWTKQRTLNASVFVEILPLDAEKNHGAQSCIILPDNSRLNVRESVDEIDGKIRTALKPS